jgi:hypothetical protein
MITLVLYIGSWPNLAKWLPCGRGRTLFILGSLGQRSRSPLLYKYNFWQQDRFRTITLVLYIGSLTNLATRFPCGRGRTLFILGSKVKVTVTINIILTTGSFPHDNFSSVYWIFTKLGHMIPLSKRKNPIYFGVITIIPFDNLYIDGRILWCTHFLLSLIYINFIF